MNSEIIKRPSRFAGNWRRRTKQESCAAFGRPWTPSPSRKVSSSPTMKSGNWPSRVQRSKSCRSGSGCGKQNYSPIHPLQLMLLIKDIKKTVLSIRTHRSKRSSRDAR